MTVAITHDKIAELASRTAQAVRPNRIILFGSDVCERVDDPFTVIRQALSEGQELYRAP